MTPQELAQSGRPGLISARRTMLDRFDKTSDAADKQEISDAVDAINDLITAADLDDLLAAAGAVGAAADELEKAIGKARMQVFAQAFQTVVNALTKFEAPKAKPRTGGQVAKPVVQTPAVPARPGGTKPTPAAQSAVPPPVVPVPAPPAATGTPAIRRTVDAPPVATSSDSTLGQLSIRFETGGRGPGTVSSGSGDAGGVSYGSYQMTSRGGGTVARFVADPAFPFKDRFAGLVPGSPEFTAAWKALAAEQGPAFHAAQHDFIKQTHYDPMVNAVRARTGFEVTTRTPALKDCCWSTAVQHGPNNGIFHTVLAPLLASQTPRPEEGAVFDEAVIRAVYAERGRRDASGALVHFRNNSPDVQQGVANRFVSELKDALAMLRNPL